MRWPWSARTAQYRGTLTLLPDNKVVVGAPDNASQAVLESAARIVASLMESTNVGRVIVLPFPVDVIDRRER